MRRRYVVACGLAAVTAAGLIALGRDSTRSDENATAERPGASPQSARWIVAGGGPTPESNEVSIEDDLRLATTVLPGEGLTLYAAGPGSKAVRVQSDDLQRDPLADELGSIFNPRPGRASRYQAARIDAEGPASPGALLDAVEAAGAQTGPPLTVYIAGHGDVGEQANDNAIVMWANFTITPVDLAKAVVDSKRQMRFVITTCFSGGFAELAFENADETSGPASADVCGLFASTWDQQAGGCDPDPDRGQHDGYGVHFLSALDGKKRDNTPLSAQMLDIDGDGRVSLLDAHTFARLSSKSSDVPTTTSERWLRHITPADADGEPITLAHEDAVIGVFAKALSVANEKDGNTRLAAIDAELMALGEEETAASKNETEAFWDASAEILSRWPVVDDPWHPLWRETIDANRAEITAFLADAEVIARLQAAMTATDQLGGKRAALEVRRAPLQRLTRAYETKRLASALSKTSGPDWDRYVALRKCENSTL